MQKVRKYEASVKACRTCSDEVRGIDKNSFWHQLQNVRWLISEPRSASHPPTFIFEANCIERINQSL